MIYLFLGAVVVSATSAVYLFRHRLDVNHCDDGWYGASAAGTGFVLLGLLIPFLGVIVRADWEIDDEGISSRPLLRRARRMQWADVQRLRWAQGILTLRDATGFVAINFNTLSKEQRTSAESRIREILSPHFDLSPRRQATVTHADVLWSLGRMGLLVVLIGGMVIGLVKYLPPTALTAAVIQVSFLLMISPVMIVTMVREMRRPDYPGRWRKRIAPA